MEDLKFLEELKCGDHKFLQGVKRLELKPNEDYGHVSDSFFIYAEGGKWEQKGDSIVVAETLALDTEPWSEDRPEDIYSLGACAMLLVKGEHLEPDYVAFATSLTRDGPEKGREIGLVPSGFVRRGDMGYQHPVRRTIRRKGEEIIGGLVVEGESGVIISEKRSGLMACYELSVDISYIRRKVNLTERKNGVLSFKPRRKIFFRNKAYEEIYMIPQEWLRDYVSENLDKYGERRFPELTSALLKRYLERA